MRQFHRPEKGTTSPPPKIKLRLALGMTCYTSSCLAVDPNSGTLAYPASGVTVLLDIVHSKQKSYIHQAQQTISCVSFSPDGNLLLIGEFGYMPALRVWLIHQEIELAKFQGHQYGIVSASFSKDMDLIVSIGSKHDNYINVWAWPSKNRLACNKFAEDIFAMSFSSHDSYFVTCGVHHIKFWYPIASKKEPNKYSPLHPHLTTLYGRPALLGDIKYRTFVDIQCGSDRTKAFVFSITHCGLLCKLSADRGVKMYKRLQNTQLSSLQIHDNQLMVGSMCGHVYFFDALTLQLKASVSLPLDICFAEQVIRSHGSSLEAVVDEYRANIYLAFDKKHRLLTAALTNGSLCVWDVSDWNNIKKKYYSVSHSRAITGLDLMSSDDKSKVKETMVTVSHDATVRLWDIAMSKGICCENSKTIYTEFDRTGTDIEESLGLHDGPDFRDNKLITAVKISPEKDYLVTGNSRGVITVYERTTLENVKSIHRHTRGITALDIFSGTRLHLRLLVSGARDRLINIFSMDNDFSLLNTLNIHSGSVTSVGLYTALDRITLVSAGLDRSLVICRSLVTEVPHFKPTRCRHTASSVIDIVVCPDDGLIGVGRISGEVTILDAETCQLIRRFKACPNEKARLEKLHIDPKNNLMLSACNDRTINVLNFTHGVVLATVRGHAKGVSGLHFSLNMKFIVSTSKDGCVFIWGLPEKVVQRGARISRSAMRAIAKGHETPSQMKISESIVQLPDVEFSDQYTPYNIMSMARKHMQRVVTVDIDKAETEPTCEKPDIVDEESETGFLEDFSFSVTDDMMKSDEKSFRGFDEETPSTSETHIYGGILPYANLGRGQNDNGDHQCTREPPV